MSNIERIINMIFSLSKVNNYGYDDPDDSD